MATLHQDLELHLWGLCRHPLDESNFDGQVFSQFETREERIIHWISKLSGIALLVSAILGAIYLILF